MNEIYSKQARLQVKSLNLIWNWHLKSTERPVWLEPRGGGRMSEGRSILMSQVLFYSKYGGECLRREVVWYIYYSRFLLSNERKYRDENESI